MYLAALLLFKFCGVYPELAEDSLASAFCNSIRHIRTSNSIFAKSLAPCNEL